MISATGDMWDYGPGFIKVIPTNIGWRNDGYNVMGRGLAQQASKRYPDLARWYGLMCRTMAETGESTLYWTDDLCLLPVKPLAANPALSWKQKASVHLIERGLKQLLEQTRMDSKVVVPMLGCGNGGLRVEDVAPMIVAYLSDGTDRFTLLSWKGDK